MTTDDVSMVSADSILQTNGRSGGQNCAGFKTKFCFDDDSGDKLTMSGWSCNDSAWFPGCDADGYVVMKGMATTPPNLDATIVSRTSPFWRKLPKFASCVAT